MSTQTHRVFFSHFFDGGVGREGSSGGQGWSVGLLTRFITYVVAAVLFLILVLRDVLIQLQLTSLQKPWSLGTICRASVGIPM